MTQLGLALDKPQQVIAFTKFYGMNEVVEPSQNAPLNSCSDSMPSVYITILNNQGLQPLEICIKQGAHRNEY